MRKILSHSVIFLLLINMLSCASHGLQQGRRALESGQGTLVLVRTKCVLEHEKLDCIPCFGSKPLVGFGLSSLNSFGEILEVQNYTLSKESDLDGWTFFVLAPGIHYLAVGGPISNFRERPGSAGLLLLMESPRWRIDVPEGAKYLYAGSIQMNGQKTAPNIFGITSILPAGFEPNPLDESQAARSLMAKHFPQAETLATNLMEIWPQGEPLVFGNGELARMKPEAPETSEHAGEESAWFQLVRKPVGPRNQPDAVAGVPVDRTVRAIISSKLNQGHFPRNEGAPEIIEYDILAFEASIPKSIYMKAVARIEVSLFAHGRQRTVTANASSTGFHYSLSPTTTNDAVNKALRAFSEEVKKALEELLAPGIGQTEPGAAGVPAE